MTRTIESLEKTLQVWEDLCLLVNLLSRFQQKQGQKLDYPLCGPFVNFDKFREFLLKSRGIMDLGKVYQMFVEPYQSKKIPALGDLAQLAEELAIWSCTSRRVYHLTSDIQLLLNATSIKNVTWQDVRLPLPAFTVLLDEPILGTFYDVEYDCILVTSSFSISGVEEIELRLIPSNIRDYKKIPNDEINLMKSFLSKKNKSMQLIKRIEKYNDLLPKPLLFPIFTVPMTKKALESSIEQSIIDLAKDHVEQSMAAGHKVVLPKGVKIMPEEGNTAAKLVVSLCLYLTTRHAKDTRHFTYRPEGIRKNEKPNQPTITDKAEIFKIRTERNLTPKERLTFSKGLKGWSGNYVTPHWRTGVYRFPPGQASNPQAEKTIWVTPCFVNKHLITEGQLPNGSKVKI